MKSDQFTLEFIRIETKSFFPKRHYLPIDPFGDIVIDLETLKLFEQVNASKNLQELKEVLEKTYYVNLIPSKEIIGHIEDLEQAGSESRYMVIRFILDRIPIEAGIRSKCYEFMFQL